MSKQDTSKKDDFFAKFEGPAKPPVMTKTVDEADRGGRPNKNAGRKHFNVYLDPKVGKALLLEKLQTETSVQDILETLVLTHLREKGHKV